MRFMCGIVLGRLALGTPLPSGGVSQAAGVPHPLTVLSLWGLA
jgi:hypothetical protein